MSTGLAAAPSTPTSSTSPEELSLEELLHAHGMRATPQRLAVHRVVCDRPRHMTAEQVQRKVADVMPGMSLPTIYATLDLFVELGLLRRIPTLSGPALYDSDRTGPRSHMICRRCQRILDLDISPVTDDAQRAAEAQGFQVESGDLVLHGLCAQCRTETAGE